MCYYGRIDLYFFLLQLGETENPNIRPVVDAVSNLYNEERLFLAKYDHQTRDNRMFHHMVIETSLISLHNCCDYYI